MLQQRRSKKASFLKQTCVMIVFTLLNLSKRGFSVARCMICSAGSLRGKPTSLQVLCKLLKPMISTPPHRSSILFPPFLLWMDFNKPDFQFFDVGTFFQGAVISVPLPWKPRQFRGVPSSDVAVAVGRCNSHINVKHQWNAKVRN